MVVAGIVALVVIPAAASAGDDGARAPQAPAPRAPWTRSGDARLLAEDARAAADLARELPADLVADQGASVFVSTTRRIGVVPMSDGGICWTATDSARQEATVGLCGEVIAKDGTSLSYNRGPGTPTSVTGIVADDVTGLVLVTGDGASHELDVSGGAVWWSGDETTEVERMLVTRAGTQYVETKLFEAR